MFENHVIYDLETFPNCFTYCSVNSDGSGIVVYEVSDRINQTEEILQELRNLKSSGKIQVGFNNRNFDYSLIHKIIKDATKAKSDGKKYKISALSMFKYANKVIESFKGDGFGIKVRDDDVVIPQIDLFLINHYNNKAKATSLKTLEFNMRSENIEDLPFEVGKKLSDDEKDELIRYNKHDVLQTLKFYNQCLGMIQLRVDLTKKYGFDCTNLNDARIGSNFFMKKIEQENPNAFYYKDENGRKVKRQTKRDKIVIKDCLFDYLKFYTKEFKALHEWFSKQVITETNGVFSDIEEHDLYNLANYCEMVVKKVKFKSKPSEVEVQQFLKEHPKGWVKEVELKSTETLKDGFGNPVKESYIDEKSGKEKQRVVKVPKKSYYGCYRIAETLNVVFNGFRIDYGVGGLHGALRGVVKESDDYSIISWDVASMYPNIAIANKVFPEHLGYKFCESYKDFYDERKKFPKGTPENLAIKLGLNATYGSSNDKFSPFYDPAYTMKITINGQLSLSMLMEKICLDCDAKLIMSNTDGFEVYINKNDIDKANQIVSKWEKYVGLQMEQVEYQSMYIRDVNNYIAIYKDGSVKYKGAYEYKELRENKEGYMHKNHSSLIVPMAVDKYVTQNIDPVKFIKSHKNPYDFMLRTKVPRNCELVLVDEDGWNETKLQNICRYYPSTIGGKLVKLMPPLEDGGEVRRMGIDTNWLVQPCNNMKEFHWDINYDYYIEEVKKLLEPFDCEIFYN